MQSKGHKGSVRGTIAERRGCRALCQDSQLPSTGSSLHTYLDLKVVIRWCIYCIFIQGIHAVESGGWEVEEDPGTGEVRYRVTACGL